MAQILDFVEMELRADFRLPSESAVFASLAENASVSAWRGLFITGLLCLFWTKRLARSISRRKQN